MRHALVVAVSLSMLALQAAGASNLPDYPFVHVTGEAVLRVAPDLGEIDFEISAHDADSAAALALVDVRIAEVRALMDQQGAGASPDAAADIAVRDVRKEMRKAAVNEPKDAPPEYDIRCAVHINVRDLGKWRPIMLALLAKPNIDRMSTGFGLRDREAVRADVTAQAIHDAQRKGEAMAVTFGKHLGAVTGISAGMLRNLTNSVGLAPLDSYRAPAGSRQGGDKDFLMTELMTFAQTVDMIFRIK